MLSTATLEAAVASTWALGGRLARDASTKHSSVRVLPVPGGPCHRVRVRLRVVATAACWLGLRWAEVAAAAALALARRTWPSPPRSQLGGALAALSRLMPCRREAGVGGVGVGGVGVGGLGWEGWVGGGADR